MRHQVVDVESREGEGMAEARKVKEEAKAYETQTGCNEWMEKMKVRKGVGGRKTLWDWEWL